MDELYTQLQAWIEKCNAFGFGWNASSYIHVHPKYIPGFFSVLGPSTPIQSDSIRFCPVDTQGWKKAGLGLALLLLFGMEVAWLSHLAPG